MSTSSNVRMRQVVDWSAAVWAGLLAGSVFLLINVFLTPMVLGGNSWVIIRLFASIPLGEAILAPPATYELKALVAALGTHYVLSVGFSLILAYIIHRGGMVTGILIGAVFGLALYYINFYTLTLVVPWFFALRSWVFIASHMVFGAMAGGIYEGLEVEEFVPVSGDA